MMAAMQDEDAQKMGVVYIMYNYVKHKEEVDFQREIHLLRCALPQRTHAAHYCYDDPTLRPFVAGIRLFIDPYSRFRLRPHSGSMEEIDFELQTFGIPTGCSPMKRDGTWSTEWHLEWLRLHRNREIAENEATDTNAKPAVIVPRRFDVLFGRGKIAKTHTGNLRALLLCEMNYPRYESAITGKYGKTEVAEQIVRIIHDSGGRFLKPDENSGWVEVNNEEAREKIAHFFRHMRFRMKKTGTTTDNDSCSSPENSQEFMTESPTLVAKQLVGGKRVTPSPPPSI